MTWPRLPVRALKQFVCILLLLAAQQVALTHQIGHLRDHPSVKLQPRDDGTRAAHSALCDYHGAFAEVLGCVGSAAPQLWLAACDSERGAGFSAAAFPATLVTPTARGPPVLT